MHIVPAMKASAAATRATRSSTAASSASRSTTTSATDSCFYGPPELAAARLGVLEEHDGAAVLVAHALPRGDVEEDAERVALVQAPHRQDRAALRELVDDAVLVQRRE